MHLRFLTFLIAHWGIPPKFLFTLLESLTSIQNFFHLLLTHSKWSQREKGGIRQRKSWIFVGSKEGGYPLGGKIAKFVFEGFPFIQLSPEFRSRFWGFWSRFLSWILMLLSSYLGEGTLPSDPLRLWQCFYQQCHGLHPLLVKRSPQIA